MPGKPAWQGILIELMELESVRDRAIFQRESQAFKEHNAAYTKVVSRYASFVCTFIICCSSVASHGQPLMLPSNK